MKVKVNPFNFERCFQIIFYQKDFVLIFLKFFNTFVQFNKNVFDFTKVVANLR